MFCCSTDVRAETHAPKDVYACANVVAPILAFSAVHDADALVVAFGPPAATEAAIGATANARSAMIMIRLILGHLIPIGRVQMKIPAARVTRTLGRKVAVNRDPLCYADAAVRRRALRSRPVTSPPQARHAWTSSSSSPHVCTNDVPRRSTAHR